MTQETRYFPDEEYQQRWVRLQQHMVQQQIPAAVILGRTAGTYDRCADLVWLTNYYGNQPGQGRRGPAGFAAVLVEQGKAPVLIADNVDPQLHLLAASDVIPSTNIFADLAVQVQVRNLDQLTLCGSDIVPLKYWSQLSESLPGVQWRFEDLLIATLRQRKSPRELVAFRQAGKVVSAALLAGCDALRNGASEADAAGEAAREVFRGGGQVHMLPIAHGEELRYLASDPLPGFSRRKPATGDLARLWITGPMFQGYWLGPGRTVVCGRDADAGQRELLAANANTVSEIIAAIRPGLSVRELVAVGDQQLENFRGDAASLSKEWPLYGHGNGLFFEGPTLSTKVGPDADMILQADMVISIEVFYELEGVGSSGFENCVIITEQGTELLTTTPLLF